MVYLANVNKLFRHCHSWLARQYMIIPCYVLDKLNWYAVKTYHKHLIKKRYSIVCTVESLSLFIFFLYLDFYVLGDDTSISLGSFMWTEHRCVLIPIRNKGGTVTCLSPPVIFLPTVPRWCFFCGPFLLFVFCFCLCHTVLSVPCSLVVTCLERTDLLALLYIMFSCVLSLSHMVSWVRCGTWLYWFLIIAF